MCIRDSVGGGDGQLLHLIPVFVPEGLYVLHALEQEGDGGGVPLGKDIAGVQGGQNGAFNFTGAQLGHIFRFGAQGAVLKDIDGNCAAAGLFNLGLEQLDSLDVYKRQLQQTSAVGRDEAGLYAACPDVDAQEGRLIG